jgi:F420-0:gamma-glutamyl ligase
MTGAMQAQSTMSGTLRGEKAPSGPAMARKMFEFMQRNLAAIITPERNRQFRQYLETISLGSAGLRAMREVQPFAREQAPVHLV